MIMLLRKFKSIFVSLTAGGMLLAAILWLFSASSQTALAAPVDLFITPSGSGDCTQGNPCDLPTALSQAVNGDNLYLAQGTYTGTGGAVITLTKSLGLYGGWDGSTTAPIIRNPNIYTTTLDGEDSRWVIYMNEVITPTIDGFVISHGKNYDGGGIYVDKASPIIQHNIISHNRTIDGGSWEDGRGGGIFIGNAGEVLIINNQIISNTAGYGAGIYHYGATTITISLNEIFENAASHRAGGILIEDYGDIIRSNIISGNISAEDSGGMLLWDSNSLVEANWIINNTANNGGGINMGNGSSPKLVNNLLVNNTKTGIYVNFSSPTIINNTIIGNGLSGAGDGIYIYSTSICTPPYCMLGDIINNILIDYETAIHGQGAITSTIDYNDIWGNTITDYLLPVGVVTGTHNISENPLFAEPGMGNYHLQSSSPCIGAGDPAGVPPAPQTDIDGQPRPGGRVDIGADEFWVSHYLPNVLR
jgi:parallel beta-helix repeat protein